MNAGCYGSEIKDILVEAIALDGKGNLVKLTRSDMGFTYRKCALPDDYIFIEAVFEGARGAPDDIRARMNKLVEDREASQPVKTKTGGSTFKNPEGHKAWQLIDEAGCRGLKRGDAQVSEKHCNFLINTADARAAPFQSNTRRTPKAFSSIEPRRPFRPKVASNR